jgi:L-methionine (R)-S-oxide reductase
MCHRLAVAEHADGAAVRLLVGDDHHLGVVARVVGGADVDLQLAEALAEAHQGEFREVLVGEDGDLGVQPGFVDGGEGGVVERGGQVDAGDLDADAGGEAGCVHLGGTPPGRVGRRARVGAFGPGLAGARLALGGGLTGAGLRGSEQEGGAGTMHDRERATPWTEHRAVSKAALYDELAGELDGLLAGEADAVANAANAAAAIYHALPELNWAGFYFLRGEDLVLGPFQGRPACVRIPLGKGVCGTAAVQRQSVLVPDVEAFPGHIACDAASRSELVVPLIAGDALLGVLDLDSPMLGRFDETDREGCERLVGVIVRHLGGVRRCGAAE